MLNIDNEKEDNFYSYFQFHQLDHFRSHFVFNDKSYIVLSFSVYCKSYIILALNILREYTQGYRWSTCRNNQPHPISLGESMLILADTVFNLKEITGNCIKHFGQSQLNQPPTYRV